MSTVSGSVSADCKLWQVNDESEMVMKPGWKPKVKPQIK